MKFSYNRSASTWEVILIFALNFLLVLGVIAAFAALGALIVSWAWNAFMPSVFGLPQITFLQAFALTMLIGSVKGLLSVNIQKKEG